MGVLAEPFGTPLVVLYFDEVEAREDDDHDGCRMGDADLVGG